MSFHSLLGVPDSASQEEITTGYIKARDAAVTEAERSKLRLVWKALTDPFYKSAYKHYSDFDALADAGIYDDGVEPEFIREDKISLDWLITPWHKILANAKRNQGERMAVLVGPGALSPIHSGHIEMMETAKAAVENNGYQVVGGYFAASNDDYVSNKYGGEASLHTAHRHALVDAAVEDSDWLMSDPWCGRWVGVELNFTWIADRLEQYLAKHLPFEVDVFCVFGADNALFARSFVERGHCVCIARGEHDSRVQKVLEDPKLQTQRIIIATDHGKFSDVSATAVRNGTSDAVPSGVLKLRSKWKQQKSEDVVYKIQDDLNQATKNWNISEEALGDFKKSVEAALVKAYRNVDSPDYAAQVNVVWHDGQDKSNEIFALSDSQITPFTISQATHTQNNQNDSDKEVKIFAKDFLLGGEQSGLQVELGEKIVRVPLMLPYSSPRTRINLQPSAEWGFSKSMWKANMDLFARTNLTVEDLDCSAFLVYLGFLKSDLAFDICAWHYDNFVVLPMVRG